MQFILGLDGKILLFIQEFLRFEWLNPIMEFITKLGDGGIFWVILAALLLCLQKYRKEGIAIAVALLLGYVITNLILKNLVIRVRPYDAVAGLQSLIGTVRSSSFPSGHTTSSIAAGFVMYKSLPKYMGVPAIVLAVLISFSRLYVGVHYPTDVIVGAVIGIFAALYAKYIVKT